MVHKVHKVRRVCKAFKLRKELMVRKAHKVFKV
jgi:hypothetical protein